MAEGAESFAEVCVGAATVVTRVRRDNLPAQGLQLGLRPESVRVAQGGAIQAQVELVERLGERTLVYARLPGGEAITAEDSGNSPVRIGDQVGLSIDGSAAHLFDADGAGHHGGAPA